MRHYPSSGHRAPASPHHAPCCCPTCSLHRTSFRIHLRAPWIRQQFFLLRVVAQAHQGQALLLTAHGLVALVIPTSEHHNVVALFQHLNNYQRHLLSRIKPKEILPVSLRVYKPNFMLGYAQALAQILPLAHPCLLPTRTARDSGYLDGMRAAGRALAEYPATLERENRYAA